MYIFAVAQKKDRIALEWLILLCMEYDIKGVLYTPQYLKDLLG